MSPKLRCCDLPSNPRKSPPGHQGPGPSILVTGRVLQDEAAIRGCIRLADSMLQAFGPGA